MKAAWIRPKRSRLNLGSDEPPPAVCTVLLGGRLWRVVEAPAALENQGESGWRRTLELRRGKNAMGEETWISPEVGTGMCSAIAELVDSLVLELAEDETTVAPGLA